jgi:hypothetical protein
MADSTPAVACDFLASRASPRDLPVHMVALRLAESPSALMLVEVPGHE